MRFSSGSDAARTDQPLTFPGIRAIVAGDFHGAAVVLNNRTISNAIQELQQINLLI